MDPKKINQLALKGFYSKDDRAVLYGKYKDKDEDKVAVICDVNRIFFLREDEFLLDLDKVYRNREFINVPGIVGSEDDYEPVTLTKELRKAGKGVVAKIVNGDYTGWYNVKYLAEYGENVTYRGLLKTIGKDVKRKVVYAITVYGNLNQLIGFVLMVNVKEV